jgi:hypothetical protein
LILIQSSNAPVIWRAAHAFSSSPVEQRQSYSVSVNDSFATLTFFGARRSDLSQLCPAVVSRPHVPPVVHLFAHTVLEEYSDEVRAKSGVQELNAYRVIPIRSSPKRRSNHSRSSAGSPSRRRDELLVSSLRKPRAEFGGAPSQGRRSRSRVPGMGRDHRSPTPRKTDRRQWAVH